MKYKLHTTSEKAWDAMLEAIENAQKSIYLEMFIFDSNTKNHDFIGKLKEKASRGISVVVVADALGSKELKKEINGGKKISNIEFLFFSHWLHHIHRKILIVDEKISFIGGVNIKEQYKHWNDLQLEIRGRIAKTLLKSFAYTYIMAGGKNKRIIEYRNKKISHRLKFWLIEHWPVKNIYTLKKHYIEKITGAQKSICIVTPYFNPPRWLISLLDNAIRRGVKVEIFVPENVDLKIMNVLNYNYMNKLHPLGIKFNLLRKMNHAKLLIIDEAEGLLGSQNINLVSFQMDAEAGIFFKNKKLIKELLNAITEWEKDSFLFKPYYRKMRIIDYIVVFLMKILKPIL